MNTIEEEPNDTRLDDTIDVLQKIDDTNDPSALYELAMLYIKEQHDFDLAISYLKESSKQNHINSSYELGSIYSQGKYGVEQDYKIAFKYLEIAANSNNPKALCNLGIFYCNGYGIEQDIEKAALYFKKSVDLGYKKADKLLKQCLDILAEQDDEDDILDEEEELDKELEKYDEKIKQKKKKKRKKKSQKKKNQHQQQKN